MGAGLNPPPSVSNCVWTLPLSEPTRKIINQTLSFRAWQGRLHMKKEKCIRVWAAPSSSAAFASCSSCRLFLNGNTLCICFPYRLCIHSGFAFHLRLSFSVSLGLIAMIPQWGPCMVPVALCGRVRGGAAGSRAELLLRSLHLPGPALPQQISYWLTHPSLC